MSLLPRACGATVALAILALLGPNGAGKSTTIGILSTLVNKSSGTVNVFGHDLDAQPAALKRCIGVVPQEFNFNQFEKVFDIVVTQAGYYGIPARLAKERAEQYLTQLGLWEKRGVASRELSGGMKRRLMIARAIPQPDAERRWPGAGHGGDGDRHGGTPLSDAAFIYLTCRKYRRRPCSARAARRSR